MSRSDHEVVLRYSRSYRFLHWTIAVLVLSEFSMQYIRRLFGEDVHAFVREMHKSIGIVLIVLIATRIGLRLATPVPAKFPDISRVREVIATWVHRGLWLFMILVPLLGINFLLARGRGVNFFGLVSVPPATAGSPYWGDIALTTHRYAAFGLIALVCLHAAGALFHRLVLKDKLLSRMV